MRGWPLNRYYAIRHRWPPWWPQWPIRAADPVVTRPSVHASEVPSSGGVSSRGTRPIMRWLFTLNQQTVTLERQIDLIKSLDQTQPSLLVNKVKREGCSLPNRVYPFWILKKILGKFFGFFRFFRIFFGFFFWFFGFFRGQISTTFVLSSSLKCLLCAYLI